MNSTLTDIKGLKFRMVFNQPSDVLACSYGKGAINGGVTISEGKASFNGSTGYVSVARLISNIKTVRIKLNLASAASPTVDIAKFTSSHNLKIASGTVQANGFSSPTIYINGAASSTIAQTKNEIIITTATGININTFELGRVSTYFNGNVEILEFYNYVLSATEVYNLNKNCTLIEPSKNGLLMDFDTRQGVLKDNTGLRTLTATYGTNDGIKKFGSIKAFKFDGTATKVDAGADWIGTGNITILGWFFTTQNTAAATVRLIVNSKTALYFRINKVQFTRDGTTPSISTSASNHPIGRWVHIAVTSTSAGINNIYINGVLDGTANQSSGTPVAGTTNVFIGQNGSGSGILIGLIPRIRPFNRILSPYEITQEFTSQRNTYGI